jgi:hypothetical protein
VHPTGGTLRVFKQFVWLGVGSDKIALSHPTHLRVTQTVSRLVASIEVRENKNEVAKVELNYYVLFVYPNTYRL